MNNRIDHFTLGTSDLDAGAKALATSMGVSIPTGSKHDAMSTHNCVMQAGNSSFMELIAIDPAAPDPGRVRWFTLDDQATRNKIAQRPRALCWVVNTPDLDAVVAGSPVDLGEVVPFQRGERSWRLTVPKDGSLPSAGLLPAFIEWSPGPHPSSAQQDLGVRLQRVLLSHPQPDQLSQYLQQLNVGHLATVTHAEKAALSFEVETPNGIVLLD